MQKSRQNRGFTLYSHDGRRKYLTAQERARFIAAAEAHPRPEIGALCLTLVYTGCRISEALALGAHCVNAEDGTLAIRSLKQRDTRAIREVPVPEALLRRIQPLAGGGALWPLSRSRAWQLVKAVMAEAGLARGPHASPRGLRHGFGVHALRAGVPVTLVQRWLGHANLATTAIYTDVLGAEERAIARRMWA